MGLRLVKDILVGALIGIVSMLPGASGATIAVVFGVYERLIGDLANLRTKLLKDIRFIVVIGVGILLGMFICAFGLDFLITNAEIPMMFFFVALILCQVPDIRRLGDDGKPVTAYNILAFAVGFAVMIAFLFIGEGTASEETASSAVVMFLVGIVLAVSKLAPGISGSTVLLALGLFTPFMEAFTNFDLMALLPIGLGLIVGVLLFSRVIDFCMTRSRKSTYSAILGLTIGSIVTVTAEALMGLSDGGSVIECAVAVVTGIVLGILLSRVSAGYAKDTAEGV